MADSGGTRPARRLRPGLLDLYLIRGAAGPFVLIIAAVVVAMMLERTLRLIHELAASGGDIAYLFPLLVRLVPYYLDLAIPAAFMVALVLLVSRLDRRLELEAMLASGLSLGRIAAPLVALGVLVGIAGLAAGGWLEPLGRHSFRALRIEARNAGRIGQLEPGAFYHPAESLAVTFDRREPDDEVGGVFVWQRLPDGRTLVITAGRGRIGFDPQTRQFGIALGAGRYVSESAAGAPRRLIDFRSIALREPLRIEDATWRRGWDQNELTLSELRAAMDDGAVGIAPRALAAEYYSRIARAALIPLLPLLVLPLTIATKKGRRGFGVLLGGALLAAMLHAINLARGLALGGGADAAWSILGTLALCGAAILLIFLSARQLPSHGAIHALLRPIGARATWAALVPRTLPNLRTRTIGAYLGWWLGRWTLAALLAVVLLLQMVDLFERGDEFVARGMGPGEVGRYVWLRLAPTVQQALPIAALAGAIAVFAAAARSREMTAIRAAGISQWQILLMALPVPAVLALTAYAMAEHAAPASQLRFAAWWAPPAQASADAERQTRWFRIGDEIVRARRGSPDGTRLADVRIFRRDRQGLLSETIAARAAIFGPTGWLLLDADVALLDRQQVQRGSMARLDWPGGPQPRGLAVFFASAQSMSAADARRSLDDQAPASQSAALFETRLHRALAEPLAAFVMLLLALPLAFVAPRTDAAWPALLYAGGGGLLYLVTDGVLTVAGQVGYLPAAVGAWAAPVFATLLAFAVLVYSER